MMKGSNKSEDNRSLALRGPTDRGGINIVDYSITLQLLAPLSGLVIPLEQVPDPVFAQHLVGHGIGIEPTGETLVAPCAGKVVQLHPSAHAITLATESGVQVLLHIGLDTVKLRGEGFSAKVKVNDRVESGQVLIEFDADFIAQKAKSLMSVMVIAEAPEHRLRQMALEKKLQHVQANKDLLLQLDLGGEKALLSEDKEISKAQSPLVAVNLATGLHARPAALLVGQAKKFQSKIELVNNEKSANAKSVVGLLGLQVENQDSVYFRAEGPDASAAVSELAKFLQHMVEAPSSGTPSFPSATATKSDAHTIGGVSAAPGLAIGRVHQLKAEHFDIPETASSSLNEKTTLAKALAQASAELEQLREKVAVQTDASQAAIFAAHQELLEDPDLIQQATEFMEQGKSAAYAWNEATLAHANRLAHLNNELMANRANDLRDVGRRVLKQILKVPEPAPLPLDAETILIAENLTPSDTVQFDKAKVLGFATVTGGATSHVAILARSLGLPALAGIEERALQIPEGTEVILDGDRGEIRLHPSEEEKQKIRLVQTQHFESRRQAIQQAHLQATTVDGYTLEVGANIGGVGDAQKAMEMGCDGVGLLRSEFLFLERTTAPTEEEQYLVYQEIANVLGPRPLVIRTLDVGGDKPLLYLPLPVEENPFLGVRGIRTGVLWPDLLREQLRAILRVKSAGQIHIMFPMVSLLEEFREAKMILEEERAKLGVAPVKVGIMVEVPSAALMAEAFAPEVDFFSIGTNDLTQYTLAMDRGHKDLAKKVDALHPSVLQLIHLTVQAAHRHGKWVGVCGGLASEPKAVPILLGMGVDELSVSIPAIPLVKSQVRSLSKQNSQQLAKEVLTRSTSQEVRDLSPRIE